MYGSLDISTSGMIAQRVRLETVAANIANKGVILDAAGNANPYRARRVHFAPGDPAARTDEGRSLGVHLAEIQIDENAIRPGKFDPTSPYAQKAGPYQGYIMEPDINEVTEQVNGMMAVRAYEANVVAAEAAKQMVAQALRLIA